MGLKSDWWIQDESEETCPFCSSEGCEDEGCRECDIELAKPTLSDIIASFPHEFSLRAFPNQRFTINEPASYVSDNEYMLVIFKDGIAFTKGSPDELRREVLR